MGQSVTFTVDVTLRRSRLHFDSNLRDQWPLYDVPGIDGLGKILITPIMSGIGQERSFKAMFFSIIGTPADDFLYGG